jgi:3-methyladenine DNA glycosylase AlkC
MSPRNCKFMAWHGIVVAVCLGLPSLVQSQASENTVEIWVSEVQKVGGEGWEELDKHSTYSEAAKRTQKWSDEHKGSLRLTRERPIKISKAQFDKLQEAKKDADRAKELLEQLKEDKENFDRVKKIADGDESFFKAEERKLGETIKEYKDRLAKSIEEAMEAAKTITSGVGKLNEAKFKQANDLVDKYNGELRSFQGVMGRNYNSGFSFMPRLKPTITGAEAKTVDPGAYKSPLTRRRRSPTKVRLKTNSLGLFGPGWGVNLEPQLRLSWFFKTAKSISGHQTGKYGVQEGGQKRTGFTTSILARGGCGVPR